MHCPPEFRNFDGSFNLRLQRVPVLGILVQKVSKVKFPVNAEYGDIVKGLPFKPGSISGIYSSHVLEHLALDELRICLQNSYRYLGKNGVFRAVLPNLQEAAENYLREKGRGNRNAASDFMRYTFLGYEKRPKGFWEILLWRLSGHHHFWMWDYESLEKELLDAGFSKVYKSAYSQSSDTQFCVAEQEGRFDYNALCIEAIKQED